MRTIFSYISKADILAHRFLRAQALNTLRISLGVVFFGFGFLKFFPGVSPAESLVIATTKILTFGVVPDHIALIGVAILECTIGLCLTIGGRLLPIAVILLIPQLIGILSPLILLTGRLFDPNPTLEAQYVIKDIILVTASFVVAATLRGATLRPSAPVIASNPKFARAMASPTPETVQDRLAVVMCEMTGEISVDELCAQYNITPSEYYRWKNDILSVVDKISEIR